MRISALAITLAGLALAAAPVSADETGIASIHTWVKVGKKTCFADHFHYGNGSGANKKAAEASAISSWASFTSLEYGSSWADIRLAVRKGMKCGASGPTVWNCSLEAIPCRPY